MSVDDDVDSKHHQCHCSHDVRHASVRQTLDEMAFERGIWYAAIHGDLDRFRLLFDGNSRKPIDVDCKDQYGYTALHYASSHGQLKACQELLNRGADVNAVTRNQHSTPLHRAAGRGHADVVRLLIDNGGRVDARDADGMTPLHRAAANDRKDIYQLLLSMKADLATLRDNRDNVAADLLKSANNTK